MVMDSSPAMTMENLRIRTSYPSQNWYLEESLASQKLTTHCQLYTVDQDSLVGISLIISCLFVIATIRLIFIYFPHFYNCPSLVIMNISYYLIFTIQPCLNNSHTMYKSNN